MSDLIASIVHAAMVAARGRAVRVIYHTLPASRSALARRAESAAKRAVADGAMIGRTATRVALADGSAIVTMSGRYDAERGIVIAKDGSASVSIIVAAPAERMPDGTLRPTACPYIGRESSPCFGMGARHAHRTMRVDRIASIASGAMLYGASACACGDDHRNALA